MNEVIGTIGLGMLTGGVSNLARRQEYQEIKLQAHVNIGRVPNHATQYVPTYSTRVYTQAQPEVLYLSAYQDLITLFNAENQLIRNLSLERQHHISYPFNKQLSNYSFPIWGDKSMRIKWQREMPAEQLMVQKVRRELPIPVYDKPVKALTLAPTTATLNRISTNPNTSTIQLPVQQVTSASPSSLIKLFVDNLQSAPEDPRWQPLQSHTGIVSHSARVTQDKSGKRRFRSAEPNNGQFVKSPFKRARETMQNGKVENTIDMSATLFDHENCNTHNLGRIEAPNHSGIQVGGRGYGCALSSISVSESKEQIDVDASLAYSVGVNLGSGMHSSELGDTRVDIDGPNGNVSANIQLKLGVNDSTFSAKIDVGAKLCDVKGEYRTPWYCTDTTCYQGAINVSAGIGAGVTGTLEVTNDSTNNKKRFIIAAGAGKGFMAGAGMSINQKPNIKTANQLAIRETFRP